MVSRDIIQRLLAIINETRSRVNTLESKENVLLTATQTLTNKTLTTPTIASFTNAQHAHTDAASGGTVAHSSLTGLTTGDPHTQYALLAGRSGGQSLSGGTAANDDLTLEGTTNATRTTSYVIMQPNGGNVGIGTTSPVYPLDVKVASDTIISIFSGGSTGYINSHNVANTLTQPLAIAGSTIGFYIGGTQKVSIDTNSVGIGTTSPSSRLEITSGGTSVENTYGTVRVNVTPDLYASGASTGTAIGLMSNTSFANQGATAQLALIQQTANANDINAGVYLSIKGWFQNSSTSLPIAIGGGYSGIIPSIFIAGAGGNGDGNVGIGTTSPGRKLHVAGTIIVDGDEGGIAGTVGFTDVSDLATRSTGVGTIKFDDTTNRDSSGFIKVYIGTTAYYVPVFSAI